MITGVQAVYVCYKSINYLLFVTIDKHSEI